MSIVRVYKIARTPDLEQVARVPVLSIPDSPIVAVAHTNSERARIWDLIDRQTHEFVTQTRGVRETRRVLIGHAQARDIEPTGTVDTITGETT